MNYVITVLVSPLSVGLLCMFVAVGMLAGRPKFARVLLLFSFSWLYIWSTGWMTGAIGEALERRYPPVRVDTYPVADAIHILGGGMGANTNDCPYAEMWGAADRVWHGARLYHAGKAPRIICSGGKVKESTIPLLVDLGVPEERIAILDQAQNTEEESRMLGLMDLKRVLLVTSAWHMRRAEMLFRKNCHFDVIPAAADYEVVTRSESERKWNLTDYIPNAESLFMNCYLFKEHFAYWCYKIIKGY